MNTRASSAAASGVRARITRVTATLVRLSAATIEIDDTQNDAPTNRPGTPIERMLFSAPFLSLMSMNTTMLMQAENDRQKTMVQALSVCTLRTNSPPVLKISDAATSGARDPAVRPAVGVASEVTFRSSQMNGAKMRSMSTSTTSDRFAGRVAIVTGGASGMGAASAEQFVQGGGHVIVFDRSAENAHAVAERLGQGEPIVGSVGDSALCDHAVAEVMRRHGRLDIVVNAAGVIVRANGVDTDDDAWERIMNVNVSGTFFMCRAALRVMVPAGRGAIVNFGSIWGDLGSSGVAAYCASKGAVHNLTRALAMDHAQHGIRVNAVCPGEVNTPMLQSERSEAVTQELLDRIASTVPMGRLASPVEIARVVAFLASDEASYMTGALVSVDAGYGAR